MLTLEVEFLSGVCFAAQSQSSAEPDWPPQPDRVFSALVAAWGSRGERANEQAALEWLEQLPSPGIFASKHEPRAVGISYVPPNDTSGKLETLPERRRRQPRMFPAAIPHHPVIFLRWDASADDATLRSLDELARATVYVGHSASLVRCRFLSSEREDTPPAVAALRTVYPGRMANLRQEYRTGRRPGAGATVAAVNPPATAAPPSSVFGARWLVLEDGGGAGPDLRAAAVVARRCREALMSLYQGQGQSIPEFLSGHQSDGRPMSDPHLAILPLADVGFRHSEGRLMGIALALPRNLEREREEAARAALTGIEIDATIATRWRMFDGVLNGLDNLKLGNLGVWQIGWIAESSKRSLQPERYAGPSTRWSSVTPVALDRHAKSKGMDEWQSEVEEIIASSCVNVGLPRPMGVKLMKHSAVAGAPSYPSGNAPSWTGWTLPGALRGRMLTHVSVEFAEKVQGPVILGAGRFQGLGLCLPAAGRES